jgi:DNA-binding response OmpR family regulator
MAHQAIALIIAEPADAERAAFEAACHEAGFQTAFEPSAEVATSKLGGRPYDALILDMSTPGAALVCMRARGKLLRNRIPILAFVPGEDEAAFARAYRAGADEVFVAGRPELLTSRLEAVARSGAPQPPSPRGDAVVADGDRARGEVLERVLRDAGFKVELAMDAFAARLQVGRPSLKVAVVDAALEDVTSLIAQAKGKGARCAWVIRVRPEQLDEVGQKLLRVERATAVNAYGPPDDVLFETNRLLEPPASENRADPRRLYGSVVRLRFEDTGKEDFGYTYNVSSVGVFVRTLAPPAGTAVTMELMPPGRGDRVRLEGEVVWRREFGATRKEPVPAGFGVRITGGDVSTWAAACPRALSIPVRAPITIDPAGTSPLPYVTHPTPVPKPASTLKRVGMSTDRLRLPGKLRSPSDRPTIDGSHRNPPGVASERMRASQSEQPGPGVPIARVDSRAPAEPSIVTGPPSRPREPQSSVEDIIASVLGETEPHEAALGSAPLSMGKDGVVEIPRGAPGATVPPETELPLIEFSDVPPARERFDELETQPPFPTDPPMPSTGMSMAPTAPPGPPSTAPSMPVVPSVPALPPGASLLPEAELASAINSTDLKSLPPSSDLDRAAAAFEARSPMLSSPELTIVPPGSLATEYPSANAVIGSREAADPWARTQHMAAVVMPPSAAVPSPESFASVPPVSGKLSSSIPTPPPRPRAKLRTPKRGVPVAIWFVAAAGVVAAGALLGAPLLRGSTKTPEPRAETAPKPTALAVPAPTNAPSLAVKPSATAAVASAAPAPEPSANASAAAEPSAAPSATVAAAPAPEPSAAPAALPSEAPASAATAPPAEGALEPDATALASLEHGAGFLYVASPLATNVYVYGNLLGPTNQRLVSKCGPRFLRLGTTPGAWQGEGFVQIVKCGGFTRVEMPR